MEHVEVIDIDEKSILYDRWKPFTPTHHLKPIMDFKDSWIAKWPRQAVCLPPNVDENTVMPTNAYSGGAWFISRCMVPVRFATLARSPRHQSPARRGR